ncbi:MAG: diheme cytochrome c-553, partial [Ginsengibacter sp.]
ANIGSDSLVKRGEYLVSIMGCDDCHSPKNMTAQGPVVDMDHRLSGYPAQRPMMKVDQNAIKNGWTLFNGDLTSAVGPWGVSFSANITSDPKTGIGNWTEEQFKKALTQGKAKGLDKSRSLLPPMPWQNFSKLHDEDIKAIYLYLLSLKPVVNIVPEPKQLSEL